MNAMVNGDSVDARNVLLFELQSLVFLALFRFSDLDFLFVEIQISLRRVVGSNCTTDTGTKCTLLAVMS